MRWRQEDLKTKFILCCVINSKLSARGAWNPVFKLWCEDTIIGKLNFGRKWVWLQVLCTHELQTRWPLWSVLSLHCRVVENSMQSAAQDQAWKSTRLPVQILHSFDMVSAHTNFSSDLQDNQALTTDSLAFQVKAVSLEPSEPHLRLCHKEFHSAKFLWWAKKRTAFGVSS